MSDYFDELETISPEDRRFRQFGRLQSLLRVAVDGSAALRRRLAEVDLAALRDPAALAAIPVLRKSSLTELQRSAPPFGELTTKPAQDFDHVFMSPGPVFEPSSDSHDWWRFGRALWAAGFRKGDVLHNCFSYHLTPAGRMFDNGARAVGCAVFPGGIGQTEQQVAAMAAIRPSGYSGTPDYLKTLLDAGSAEGLDLSSIRRALVSGGALFPSLRQDYADRGVACLQCYATADVGLIAYESPAMEGMIVDEGVILEIVRPGTNDPVPDGEVGEVVVTPLNPDYPLLRFGTGDLSAILPGASPCGRTGLRIKGWMGRADQRTKIKGMFVDAPHVAQVVDAHPEVSRARVVVTRSAEQQDVFVIRAESATMDPALAEKIGSTVSATFKLRGKVELVPIGTLPNDGKVIEDARNYDQ